MSELPRYRLSWVFVALVFVAAAVMFVGVDEVVASSDEHDEALVLRQEGEIVPLVDLLGRAGLQGQRVLEAELEHKHGRWIYELEVLDGGGTVRKRHYDAHSGEYLNEHGDD